LDGRQIPREHCVDIDGHLLTELGFLLCLSAHHCGLVRGFAGYGSVFFGHDAAADRERDRRLCQLDDADPTLHPYTRAAWRGRSMENGQYLLLAVGRHHTGSIPATRKLSGMGG